MCWWKRSRLSHFHGLRDRGSLNDENSTWIVHDMQWIMFYALLNFSLGFDTKPRDHDTSKSHNPWLILIWCAKSSTWTQEHAKSWCHGDEVLKMKPWLGSNKLYAKSYYLHHFSTTHSSYQKGQFWINFKFDHSLVSSWLCLLFLKYKIIKKNL